MYSIIGATGHVGGVVASELLNKERFVRVIIRNPAKASYWKNMGAEVAIADLNDKVGLTAAIKGTSSVFVMTPPLFYSENPIQEHQKMLENIFSAIVESGVESVVYLSSIGGHLSSGTGAIVKLYDMEQKLQQLSISTVGIRAGWFMENFESSMANVISNGKLQSFISPTDLKIPMVAAQDIGQLAASLLTSKTEGHQLVELEGPELYSTFDVANDLGELTGKNIEVQAIPPVAYTNTYRSFGLSESAAHLMAEMNIGFNSGHICFEEKEGIPKLYGPTTLKTFLRGKIEQ